MAFKQKYQQLVKRKCFTNLNNFAVKAMFKKIDYRLKKKINVLNINVKICWKKNYNKLLFNSLKLKPTYMFLLSYRLRTLLHGRRNVCSLTGNYRSVFQNMQISRHSYRTFGDNSILPNFSKISWKCLI